MADNIQTVTGLYISPDRNEVRDVNGQVLPQYQYRPSPLASNLSNEQLDRQIQQDRANNQVALFNVVTRLFERFTIAPTSGITVIPGGLVPTYEVREPWEMPPSTFRARTLKDVYTIASNLPTFYFTYQVGVKPTMTYDFAVRNNTVSHTLDFETIVPSFISVGAPAKFQIAPGEIFKFSFSLNENDLRQRIFTGQLQYEEIFFLNTQVLNANGPVYVATPLSPLTI